MKIHEVAKALQARALSDEIGAVIEAEEERSRAVPRGFWRWRDRLFILTSNNMLDATEFFRIPPNRVVELGGQIEI